MTPTPASSHRLASSPAGPQARCRFGCRRRPRGALERCVAAVALFALLAALPLAAEDAAAGRTVTIPKGKVVEGLRCKVDPTQSYSLYLPTSYRTDREWPILFVFDPRGRATVAAEIFVPAAERYGWVILSSNDTRSDGPWEPNARAVTALLPEPGERWHADPDRIYAAGFSGGAIVAWVMAHQLNALAGVIASGGRRPPEIEVTDSTFAHFGAAGATDFNYDEMKGIDALLAERGNPHRFEVFDGRHQWLPPELATEAVEWLELVAMKRDLRPRDPELVEALYRKGVESAEALLAGAEASAAARRFESLVATFEGLRDVGELVRRATAVRGEPVVRAALEEEARLDAWEARYYQDNLGIFTLLKDETVPMPAARIVQRLQIPELRSRAAAEGHEGTVARRILETLFVQTNFYLPREFTAAGRHADAETALAVAVEIHQESMLTWYNLGCAAARAGHRKRALAALERAVELGFDNRAHMTSDPDLERLRGDRAFDALLARMSG